MARAPPPRRSSSRPPASSSHSYNPSFSFAARSAACPSSTMFAGGGCHASRVDSARVGDVFAEVGQQNQVAGKLIRHGVKRQACGSAPQPERVSRRRSRGQPRKRSTDLSAWFYALALLYTSGARAEMLVGLRDVANVVVCRFWPCGTCRMCALPHRVCASG